MVCNWSIRPRGRCPVCGKRHNLNRKTGLLAHHYRKGRPGEGIGVLVECEGAGRPPTDSSGWVTEDETAPA